MIDHSNHSHPATPAARSKCRRQLEAAPRGFCLIGHFVNNPADLCRSHGQEVEDLGPHHDPEFARYEGLCKYEGGRRNGPTGHCGHNHS